MNKDNNVRANGCSSCPSQQGSWLHLHKIFKTKYRSSTNCKDFWDNVDYASNSSEFECWDFLR